MFKPTIFAALGTLLLASSTSAAPLNERDACDPSGPKIELIFFSDTNCTTTVPSTIYTRAVYGDVSCYVNPDQAFSSVQILHIDDQFIGTNSALQVGRTDGDTCDGFGASVKFNIANEDLVGKCQYIGIPKEHFPDQAGNEYRLTTLEG